MSRNVNKVILVGNLTRDPEMRQTTTSQPVCTFGIATNRTWKTGDNVQHSSAEFHEIVTWSKLAEICGQFLKKGMLVYIEGYLKTRSWETPEGVRKYRTEIVAQDMIRLEKGMRVESTEGDEPFIPEEEAGEIPLDDQDNLI